MARAFFASPSPLPSPPRHGQLHRRTLSSTFVDESVAAAAALVHKWHPDHINDGSPAATCCSLFLHEDEVEEAQRFLRAAADLHRAMLFFASDVTDSQLQSGHGLVQAQALLQAAMRRLDLELSILLGHTHTTSAAGAGSDDRASRPPPPPALVASIRAVAQAMMAAGYGKECVSTFRSRRRTALATKLQRLLGVGGATSLFHNNKLTWEQMDATVIPSWLATAAVAFNSLFAAEKDLCGTVFAGAAVGDAVFAAIANDQATGLLAVAEAVVARAKRAPERLFRVLDVHDALTQALPALVSVFGGYSSSEVATRAAVVVAKAGEAVRSTLSSFEAAIRKEPSKATAAGGAVHPLTRYVMNYLVFLADYQEGLALIYDDDDYGQQEKTGGSSLSSSSASSSSFPPPPIIHRLLSVLLGKLEAKAGCYREVALSYLFLANNTQYVGNKVAGSTTLQAVLGEGWAEEQRAKARAHVDVYVRAAWGKVMAAVSSGSMPAAAGVVEQAVMEAAAMQEQWAAADEEMGEALRVAATVAVVPKYRMFYRRHGAALRLTPGDVTTMIAALFGGGRGGAAGIPTATRTTSGQRRCTDDRDRRRHEDPNPNPNPRRPPPQLST
ncbi:hypothetical protein BS78_05G000800 [Paspalum vaginatum]|nr:hypothetical protein BS78_05G000800 [Paspalum vaginatum]